MLVNKAVKILNVWGGRSAPRLLVSEKKGRGRVARCIETGGLGVPLNASNLVDPFGAQRV